jgi:deoxyribodipyrimidine photo-lyase
MDNTAVAIFWHRRDLRLQDNTGLHGALKSGYPVLPVFIFDKEILDALDAEDDARVTFIYDTVADLKAEYQQHGSNLQVFYDKPEHAIAQLIKQHRVAAVYTNHDYEPYANKRDEAIKKLLAKHRYRV